MNIHPLKGRVLVRIAPKREREGVIVVPEEYRKTPNEGVVIEAGPKAAPELKPGVEVIFLEYGGTEFRTGGETFVLLDPKEIVALKNGEVGGTRP